MENNFTKFEIARILGARALQIAMDAPLLLKISAETLKEIKYDSLKIAEMELSEKVLPIEIHRPSPLKSKEKLLMVKEEQVSDEELIARAQEVEKEIAEDAREMGLINEADADEDSIEEDSSLEEQ